jgi:MFS family permease
MADSPEPPHATSKRRLTLASCCSVHGIQDGLTDVLYVLLPVLAEAFGLNYSQVGMIRGANRGAMALFEMPSGMLSERLGERSLMTFGLLAVAAGYLGLAQADGFRVAFACLLLAGFGAAFQHTLSSTLVSRTFRQGGFRTALGAYNSSGDVGKLVFAGVFTWLIGAGLHWQVIVAGLGTVSLLSAAALFAVLGIAGAGGTPRRIPAFHMDVPASSPGWGLRDKTGFGSLCIIVFMDIVVQGGFLTFLAFLMIEKQVPTHLAAFAVVLTLTGGVFGKFGCGFLADRLGVIRALILVEVMTAGGILAVFYLPTLPAYCLLPVLGIFLQGSSTITYGTVGDLVHPERQARGFGIIYSVANAAVVTAPVALGLVADRFGLGPVMISMAIITLIPLPFCIPLGNALTRLSGNLATTQRRAAS